MKTPSPGNSPYSSSSEQGLSNPPSEKGSVETPAPRSLGAAGERLAALRRQPSQMPASPAFARSGQGNSWDTKPRPFNVVVPGGTLHNEDPEGFAFALHAVEDALSDEARQQRNISPALFAWARTSDNIDRPPVDAAIRVLTETLPTAKGVANTFINLSKVLPELKRVPSLLKSEIEADPAAWKKQADRLEEYASYWKGCAEDMESDLEVLRPELSLGRGINRDRLGAIEALIKDARRAATLIAGRQEMFQRMIENDPLSRNVLDHFEKVTCDTVRIQIGKAIDVLEATSSSQTTRTRQTVKKLEAALAKLDEWMPTDRRNVPLRVAPESCKKLVGEITAKYRQKLRDILKSCDVERAVIDRLAGYKTMLWGENRAEWDRGFAEALAVQDWKEVKNPIVIIIGDRTGFYTSVTTPASKINKEFGDAYRYNRPVYFRSYTHERVSILGHEEGEEGEEVPGDSASSIHDDWIQMSPNDQARPQRSVEGTPPTENARRRHGMVRQGVPSGDVQNTAHPRNMKVSQLFKKGPDGKDRLLTSIVGHGVLDPWMVNNALERARGAMNGATEVLTAAISADVGVRDTDWTNTTAPAKLKVTHVNVNLISPDWARAILNLKDMNEKAYTKSQFDAYESAAAQMTSVHVDEHKKVACKVDAITFSFGINPMSTSSVQHLARSWGPVEDHNQRNMVKFIGKLDLRSVGGFIGKVIDTLNNGDPEQADLQYMLKFQAAKVRQMFLSEVYRTHSGDPAKMGREILFLQTLAQRALAFNPDDGVLATASRNCKSDKDRGGVMDLELKDLAIAMDLAGPGEYERGPRTDEGVWLYRILGMTCGALEVQRWNTGLPGSKEIEHLDAKVKSRSFLDTLIGFSKGTKA